MADTPLINGITYDYASIEVQIEGEQFVGLSTINYDDTLEPGFARGTHPQWIGRTTGDYESTGSFTLLKGSANELRKLLGNGYMTKIFNIVVHYGPDGQPLITDELLDCRITKIADSHTQGTDAVVEEWTINPRKVKRDGLDPLPNMF